MKIGFGIDVHRLVKNEKLILGGVQIQYKYGLSGHSDADVLTHALMDAILGALGRGDIGKHFPDKDPCYQDIDSFLLLAEVKKYLGQDNYQIGNIDLNIIAEAPRVSPYYLDIKKNYSQALKIPADLINIKATTTEKMGFIGRGEGIAAQSIVLLKKEGKN